MARLLFGVPIMLLIAVMLFAVGQRVAKSRELARAGMLTQGRIEAKHCSQRGQLSYAFEVNGRTYQGTQSLCTASCEESQVGEAVEVFYLPRNPHQSVCGGAERATQVAESAAFRLWPVIFISAVLIFGVLRFTRLDAKSS